MNQDAGRIGIASLIAFAVSQAADAGVYHYTGSVRRSNLVGAAIDSILFPTIAFGSFAAPITVGQFIAKVLGGEAWNAAISTKVSKSATTDRG